MLGGVLQDWITVRGGGGSGVKAVTQSEPCWLDLAGYDDVVLYLDVRELTTTGTLSMNYQTSPSRDEASFINMVTVFTLALTPTPRVDPVLASYAAVPLARFLRWSLTTVDLGTWDATFRILLAAYAPGMQRAG
jgi:hypothetical protein